MGYVYQKQSGITNNVTTANRTQISDTLEKILNKSSSNVPDNNSYEYNNIVQQLRDQNPELTFENWSNTLLQKHKNFNDKVTDYYPDMSLLADFELSIKTIPNVEDITLPFMGIVFAVPSSMKSQFFKLLNLPYSYYTDKFTARSLVSHSANVKKE